MPKGGGRQDADLTGARSPPEAVLVLRATARSGASAERLWALFTGTRYWPAWGPSIRAVEPADQTIESGSSGRVLTAAGLWLPFEITRLEPRVYWTWRVGGLEATGHRLAPDPAGGTRVTFELPAWAFAYWPVCRTAAIRIARLGESIDNPQPSEASP